MLADADVSIHAPRAGRDLPDTHILTLSGVSIHAPRAGRDGVQIPPPILSWSFNPRAPCGARHLGLSLIGEPRCFNPRAPCGARRPVCLCRYQA